MRIELISVGSELLSGKINTDIAYIGQKLNGMGLKLDCETTVPDDIGLMGSALADILARADVIFITGGLGPTFDDLTREAVSGVLKRKLQFDRGVMEKIARRFADRNAQMPDGNDRQAYILDGAQVIDNETGTAPGQLIEVKQKKGGVTKVVILLPGPPGELQPMLENSVLPYLKSRYERRILKSRVLHVSGMPESKVDSLIRPVVETERRLEKGNVTFTILANKSIVDLKTQVEGEDETLVDEMLHNITKEIYELLGENIFGEDAQTLEGAVGELLVRARKTLSVAESCTGGMVSSRITDVSGSSVYFTRGVVVYSNQSKIDTLKVSPEVLEKYGAVSGETALEMARGAREAARSDYGLSITGIAGPTGATKDKPIGIVFFGFSSESYEIAHERRFMGKRADIKEFATNHALDLLRRQLLGELKK